MKLRVTVVVSAERKYVSASALLKVADVAPASSSR